MYVFNKRVGVVVRNNNAPKSERNVCEETNTEKRARARYHRTQRMGQRGRDGRRAGKQAAWEEVKWATAGEGSKRKEGADWMNDELSLFSSCERMNHRLFRGHPCNLLTYYFDKTGKSLFILEIRKSFWFIFIFGEKWGLKDCMEHWDFIRYKLGN